MSLGTREVRDFITGRGSKVKKRIVHILKWVERVVSILVGTKPWWMVLKSCLFRGEREWLPERRVPLIN